MSDNVQTSLVEYPDVPDTSLSAYNKYFGTNKTTVAGANLGSLFTGRQRYDDWKAQQETEYQNALKHAEYLNEQYYNYRESLEGQRELAEEAGYNPNLLTSSGSGSSAVNQQAHPIASYDANQSQNGLDLLSQFLPTLQSLASLKQMNANSDLISSKTKEQDIKNTFAKMLYSGKGYEAISKGSLSYLKNSGELQRVFGSDQNLSILPWLDNEFMIGTDFEKGSEFRKTSSQFNLMQNLMSLRNSQIKLNDVNTRTKKWILNNQLPLEVSLLTGRKDAQDIQNSISSFIDSKKEQKYILDYILQTGGLLSRFFSPIKL